MKNEKYYSRYAKVQDKYGPTAVILTSEDLMDEDFIDGLKRLEKLKLIERAEKDVVLSTEELVNLYKEAMEELSTKWDSGEIDDEDIKEVDFASKIELKDDVVDMTLNDLETMTKISHMMLYKIGETGPSTKNVFKALDFVIMKNVELMK